MSTSSLRIISIVALLAFLFACQPDDERPAWESAAEKGEQFGGGEATVFDESVNAFGQAAPNLTGNKSLEFVSGNALFKRNWVSAPASTEDLDGLGPLFNARSCSGCHHLDGRGAPPSAPGEVSASLVFLLSQPADETPSGTAPDGVHWETIPDEQYGVQLNHLAVLGVEPEGEASVTYEELPGQYLDGMPYSLRRPQYTFTSLRYGEFSPRIMVSPRVAPHMVGMGLLEAIDEATLTALADPDDTNHDGISGRVNYVPDRATRTLRVGRFGWKANQPSVRQQVAAAFRGDIGITSTLFPEQPCAPGQTDCQQAISGGEPELTEDILDRVSLYSATLAVPRRRNWDTPEVLRGKSLFNRIGCESCHTAKLTTGTHPDIPEFSDQVIRPYTDLLLHDMGEALADGRPDGQATGNEWRTPPLWGIGLIPTVSGHSFLLHDGRARTLEEAILWHGGEAVASQQQFTALSPDERQAVIIFLESL